MQECPLLKAVNLEEAKVLDQDCKDLIIDYIQGAFDQSDRELKTHVYEKTKRFFFINKDGN